MKVSEVIKLIEAKTGKKVILEDKEISQAKKLSDVKKGEYIWRLMSRYNPQLGNYYVFNKELVESVTGKSIILNYQKFDKITGEMTSKSSSGYGSANYTIMTNEDAKKKNKELESEKKKVRGFN